MKILVIEDEQKVATFIKNGLDFQNSLSILFESSPVHEVSVREIPDDSDFDCCVSP